jgi:hypothetical protein
VPFSDWPPPMVIPECAAGRTYALNFVEMDTKFRFCEDFVEATTPVYNDADLYRPVSLPQCASRSAAGDRRHSWCFRCPSGFMFARLHVHDAERRDCDLAPIRT